MVFQFMKFIQVYLLSWMLIFTPTSFAQTTAPSASNPSNATECNKDPSRSWNAKLNRCIYTKKAVTDRQEYRECAKIEDNAARKKCHDDYAKRKAGNLKNSKENKMGMGLAGVNAALAAINWIGSKGTGNTCMSKTMFTFTAIGGVLAEVYFQFMAKKKVDELKGGKAIWESEL